jgi:hypothetical protein
MLEGPRGETTVARPKMAIGHTTGNPGASGTARRRVDATSPERWPSVDLADSLCAMRTREDAELDALIASVTSGADDDRTGLAALTREIQSALRVPTFGLVLGERVQIEGVELPSPRRGITALLRKNGRSQPMSLLDVVLPGRSRGALLVRAYQRWAGASTESIAEANGPVLTPPVRDTLDAIVLKTASETARLRPLGEDEDVTLRGSGSDIWRIVPGQIVTVKPHKRWTHRRSHYLSGSVQAARLDVPALGLRPLEVRERGPLGTCHAYSKEFRDLWEKVAAGANVAHEMVPVVPGADEGGPDDDPVEEAIGLRHHGDLPGAEKALMELLHADLRCLDAHALLGAWAFDTSFDSLADRALLHYEVGTRIGEQALGDVFEGRLPWALVDNRPFLRCLHGYGLALWREGRLEEARSTFERLCILNPHDDLEARFAWKAVRDGVAWTDGRAR